MDAAATARAYAENLLPLLAPDDATPWADGGHADLIDAELDSDARAVTYHELPEAHRKAMEVGYGGPLP